MRDLRPGRYRLLDVEDEAFALRKTLRQGSHHANQLHILPFPRFRQIIGQPDLRPPAGPDETEDDTGQHDDAARRHGRTVPRNKETGDAGQRECTQQDKPGQFALHLQYQDTCGESENRQAHRLVVRRKQKSTAKTQRSKGHAKNINHHGFLREPLPLCAFAVGVGSFFQRTPK